jgi:SCP-2 sterol transfer family protein
LHGEEARGESALIEIRVRRQGTEPDRWQLLIARGRCHASRQSLGEPDSEITFGGADFLRFSAGQVSSTDLFRARRISVDGSLVLAARLPSMFRLDSGADSD